jgi:phosphoribosylglycinamide formyltransferase-1
MPKKRLALFISGKGTNAMNLINYFNKSEKVIIAAVLSTKENETVESLCKENRILFEYKGNKTIEADELVHFCKENNVDWIVLAGFLKKIPEELVHAFRNKIINIHPSLLPDFGGKGMYGMRVHEAVIEAKATKSGITIHYVNEEFDKGELIAQFETPITEDETPTTLASKIHKLEMTFFPKVVEEIVLSN